MAAHRKWHGPCSADGCERKAITRGMCDLHYRRSRRGDPSTTECAECQTTFAQPTTGKGRAGRRFCCDECARRNIIRRAAERTRRFRQENPEEAYRREQHYRRKNRYGMTREQWSALVAAQDGLCAICRRERPLHVDHHHDTAAIRGLLCGPCNRGIGLFGDDPDRLRSAADYLNRPKLAPVDHRPAVDNGGDVEPERPVTLLVANDR